jgi:hypothetical protein
VDTDLWANPSPIDGTITAWHELDANDPSAPRAAATASVLGQFVYIVGGSSGGDTLDATILRADVAQTAVLQARASSA